jgi:hypothetical protein
MKSALSYRREAYRLWFEYLRVAHGSSRPDVQEALKRSASFYAPWGDVRNTRFDLWWKEKGHLFEDKYVVRRLSVGDLPADPEALIVEIPLTQSQSVLIKRVAEIMRDEFAKKTSQTKSRKDSTAQFGLTIGAEPKLDAVREMLTVYRDVYLKHPNARGKALLHEMRAHYLNRKQKRFAKIPEQLDDTKGKLEDRMRNLRRYISKAERVTLNVASGQFPGKY